MFCLVMFFFFDLLLLVFFLFVSCILLDGLLVFLVVVEFLIDFEGKLCFGDIEFEVFILVGIFFIRFILLKLLLFFFEFCRLFFEIDKGCFFIVVFGGCVLNFRFGVFVFKVL